MNTEITQKSLERYYDLAQRQSKIREKREQLREELLELLWGDALVQPGRFVPRLNEFQARPLTKDNVIGVLGEEEFELLRDQIEPVDRVIFRVIDSGEDS